MYQIIEFFQNRPGATAADAIDYFGRELDIPNQIGHLKGEGSGVRRIRTELRPLLQKKRDIEEKLRYVLSDIETEVAIKYPPRQGSKEDRDTYRDQLKKVDKAHIELTDELKIIADKQYDLEGEMDEIDRNAKNARRLTELYQIMIGFILSYKKEIPSF